MDKIHRKPSGEKPVDYTHLEGFTLLTPPLLEKLLESLDWTPWGGKPCSYTIWVPEEAKDHTDPHPSILLPASSEDDKWNTSLHHLLYTLSQETGTPPQQIIHQALR